MTATSFLQEIDHIGIAVNDLEAAVGWYQKAFGASVELREVVESQGVEEVLLKVAESYIQLLVPTQPNSPIAKFLASHGEGLHHVAYRVGNCADALKHLSDLGVQLVDTEPKPGSRGTKVAFVHPKAAFGTLIELVEEAT